jgi:ketosteroid isomerase-like protein
MPSRPRDTIALPTPIASYFAADTANAEAVVRCFSEDAVVVDEDRTHRGPAAIARWKADATAQYQYTSEPLSVEASGRETIVIARVTGNFPGSPVTLRYRFTLAGDAIARLEITS